jgi:hypothetical protein
MNYTHSFFARMINTVEGPEHHAVENRLESRDRHAFKQRPGSRDRHAEQRPGSRDRHVDHHIVRRKPVPRTGFDPREWSHDPNCGNNFRYSGRPQETDGWHETGTTVNCKSFACGSGSIGINNIGQIIRYL